MNKLIIYKTVHYLLPIFFGVLGAAVIVHTFFPPSWHWTNPEVIDAYVVGVSSGYFLRWGLSRLDRWYDK